jgi:hypothetical protein
MERHAHISMPTAPKFLAHHRFTERQCGLKIRQVSRIDFHCDRPNCVASRKLTSHSPDPLTL